MKDGEEGEERDEGMREGGSVRRDSKGGKE